MQKPIKFLITQSFKSLKQSIAENSNNVLFDDSCDPDVNFFNISFENKTLYLPPEELKSFLDYSSPLNYFSISRLNIRSIKKNFESFKLFLKSIRFTFSVIFVFETWLNDLSITRDTSYELPNYTSNHQIRRDHKGGRVFVYRKPLTLKPDSI